MGEGLSPYPFVLIFPQDAHERLLVEKLEAAGVKVERRTELLRFDQHEGGVLARAQAAGRLRGKLRGSLSRRLRRGVVDGPGTARYRLPGWNLRRTLLRR